MLEALDMQLEQTFGLHIVAELLKDAFENKHEVDWRSMLRSISEKVL